MDHEKGSSELPYDTSPFPEDGIQRAYSIDSLTAEQCEYLIAAFDKLIEDAEAEESEKNSSRSR